MIYRLFLLIIIIGLLINRPAVGQRDTAKAANGFNRFQHFLSTQNADSCFFYAQAIAQDDSTVLTAVLHDYFAQSFISSASTKTNAKFSASLLKRLDEGSATLRLSLFPLKQWVTIRNETDSLAIRRAVSDFVANLIGSPEVRGNRIDRYALLLCQSLKTKRIQKMLSDSLHQIATERIGHAVSQTYYDGNYPGIDIPSRAYYRYLMAYLDAQKAEIALMQGQADKATEWYAAAVQDGPDEFDQAHKAIYSAESALLFDGKQVDNFLTEYANELMKTGDTTATLQTIAEIAFTDFSKIPSLKAYYQQVRGKAKSFNDYWRQAINTKYKMAEPFAVTTLNSSRFSSTRYKGKWILLDFWGTWCKPCVEELPVMQQFYQDVRQGKHGDLTILTLACFDTEQKVNEFMVKNKYSFPVAMGSEALTKQFRVGGYPTKVLITPAGRRIRIKDGQHWIERVQTFMNP